LESTVIESSQSVFCQDQPLEAGQSGKSPAVNRLYDVVLQHELLKAHQLGKCIWANPVQVVRPHVQPFYRHQPEEHVPGQRSRQPVIGQVELLELSQLLESSLGNIADIVPVHVQLPERGQPGEHVVADALDGVVTESDHAQVVHVRNRVPGQLHDVIPDQGEVLQPGQIGKRV